MKYRLQAAQSLNHTVNISDSSAADVELLVTVVYSIYVNGSATTKHNRTYSMTVLTQHSYYYYHTIK